MSHGQTQSERSVKTGWLSVFVAACARRPWRVIAAWIIAIALIGFGSATVGGDLVDEFTIPDSDAQRATDLLEERFAQQSGEAASVVFVARDGRLDSAANREPVERALAAAAAIRGVEEAGDPFEASAGDLSEDGRVAFADVQFSEAAFEVPLEDVERLQEDVRAALEGSAVQAEFTGPVIQASEEPETGTSEMLGVLAAVVILVLMLGAAVAAGLPILLALLSVGLGLTLLTLAAAVTNFNTITPVLATMLGLGVGIDYALFIVTRFRQGLHDGLPPEEAAARAGATAGRAVLFAGITVAVSISGLAVIGLDFITKLGLGAAITVVTAVAAATTLLPAVLSLLGHRVDALRVPGMRARNDSESSREASLMGRWGRFVTRRARFVVPLAVALLVVLAIPVSDVQLGSTDAGSSPPSTSTRKAYDLLADGFGPGFNGPLLVAVDQSADPGAAERLAAALRRVPGVDSVPDPRLNDSEDTAVVVAFPTTSPQSEETAELVGTLRDDVIPQTLRGTGAAAYVGGSTAAFEDIASRIDSRFPLFLLVVVGITFVMMSMAFRSIVVALKAAVTTLLSALAAFGVLIAVFQWGWAQELIGLDRTGPIESFLPVIVFSILFGLSMDYEVFLVSRIREAYVAGAPARRAIRIGMSSIGRVVVAAALIMSVVFLSFLLGDDRVIKEFGIALGFAILIDAFIVRLSLVPALMHLVGDRMWYLPRWLDRALPQLTIEPPESPHVAPDHSEEAGGGHPRHEPHPTPDPAADTPGG